MWQNDKLEQLRTLLETLSTCCADKATEAKLEQCRLLLNDILNAIPGAGSGNYALETSMQTSLSRLQSILDRITSIEDDLGYDSLFDPLDTQKGSLDDVQGKLQDILDAMPEVDALMTEAKGEAIRTLIQSIYDDCCPNAILGDIAADAAAIEQDTAAIAADAAAIEQDTAAIEQDTAAIAADTDLMVFDVDRVRQECETIALQTGNTRVAAENIEAALPDLQESLEDLEICCTNQSLSLDQIQANTDHLDQMSTDLAQIEADVAAQAADIAAMKTDITAIKDCVCSGLIFDPCRCFEGDEPTLNEAEEGVDFHEDDPAYDPPDGSADWATFKLGKCRKMRHTVNQFLADLRRKEAARATIGKGIVKLVEFLSIVKMVKNVSAAPATIANPVTLAKGGVVTAGKVAAGVSLIFLEILGQAFEAAYELGSSVFDDVYAILESIKCQMVEVLYCAKTGNEMKNDWDELMDEHIGGYHPIYGPVWAYALKLSFSLDAMNILAGGQWEDEIPDVLTECACNCMSDWHDPDLAVHTHDDLRSMTLSGNVITQWDNTGAAGGYFAPTGSPTFDGDYVQMGQYKRMAWTSGSWGDGRFFSLYAVLELGAITNKWVMGQQGQDTNKPMVIHRPTVLELALVGGDQKNISPPTGRFLVGMRREGGLTHFTLNGSGLGTLVGAGSPGVYPPFYLGSPTALQNGTDARIWAVVGWLRPTELTQAQEDDIINNLTALYGPFGV